MYAFKKAHLRLPRTSDGQARALRHIPRSHLKRGDLVFFHHGGNVYHAAIFLKKSHGKRIILHAPLLRSASPPRGDLDRLMVRSHASAEAWAPQAPPLTLTESRRERAAHLGLDSPRCARSALRLPRCPESLRH